MRFIKNVFFGFIAFLAAMVVLSFFLPEKYIVEKSIHINAPVDLVFEQVNDLTYWEDWSYFANLDANWKVDLGNWTSGKNASMRWQSAKLGNGQLRIIESIPNNQVHVYFEYDEPGKGGNAHYFFKEKNDGTTATFQLEFPIPLNPKDKFDNIFFERDYNNDSQLDYSLNHLKGVSEKKFREKIKNNNG